MKGERVAKSKENESRKVDSSGRFSYQGLDRALHEKARLGIMTSLLTHPDGVTFNDLKTLCELTDGNLNRHLDVLQDEGFVTLTRQTGSGRPTTSCQLTSSGRKKFLAYLEELQRVIADANAAVDVRPGLAPKFRLS